MRYIWAISLFVMGIYASVIYPERLKTAPEWFSQIPALFPSNLWVPGAQVVGVILVLASIALVIPWGEKTKSLQPISATETEEPVIPDGYMKILSAPENVEVRVIWGSLTGPREYGRAKRVGNTWYITSERNPHANNRPCATPSGWEFIIEVDED